MHYRRKIGRPLLVVAATSAAVLYSCSSEMAGNLAAPPDDAGADASRSEVSGNLSFEGGFDAGQPEATPSEVAGNDGGSTDLGAVDVLVSEVSGNLGAIDAPMLDVALDAPSDAKPASDAVPDGD